MSGGGRYVVGYERDQTGWWVAKVKGVRGCHTQGRTIEEAERRIREALQACGRRDAKTAKLERQLPAKISVRVKSVVRVRAQAVKVQEEASRITRQAIRDLQKELGLSVRDVGTLLEISGQRVQQLAESA